LYHGSRESEDIKTDKLGLASETINSNRDLKNYKVKLFNKNHKKYVFSSVKEYNATITITCNTELFEFIVDFFPSAFPAALLLVDIAVCGRSSSFQ
jgi:hypothetical protein